METVKKKSAVRKKTVTSKKNLPEKKEEKRVSQTWLAMMEARKNPLLKIIDMEAVLQ
jgi:hypothetical protein